MKEIQDRVEPAVSGNVGRDELIASDLPFRFDELDIAVISDRGNAGGELIRELQRTRGRVRHIWPIPERIPEIYDVVYCDFVSDLPRRLPWSPGEPSATLVLVVSPSQRIELQVMHNCTPDGLIHMPSSPQAVFSSLALARSHFLYAQRLRKKIEKLDENLRTMRSVERAKVILMQTRNISEEEAYHFLRRQAMQKRVTIGVLACTIVDSQELLC